MTKGNQFVMIDGKNMAVRMIGQWVGVVWTTHEVKKEIFSDGIRYVAKIDEIVNKRDASIQFISIVQDKAGNWYEDDDNYATDWHDPKTARIMAAELIAAAEYVDNLQIEKGAATNGQ